MPIRTTEALVVRRGVLDETLVTAGWTRLLASLALGGARGHVETGMLTTTIRPFDPRELDRIEAHLTDPPLDDLDRIRRHLIGHPPDRDPALAGVLRARYGARGPGLLSFPETGLGSATPEGLRAELARWSAEDGPPTPSRRGEGRGAHGWSPERTVASGVVRTEQAAALGEALVVGLREEVGGTGVDAPWWRAVPVDAGRSLLLVNGWSTRDRRCRWHDQHPTLLDELALPAATDFNRSLWLGAHPKVLDYGFGLSEQWPPLAGAEGTGRRHRTQERLLLRIDERAVTVEWGHNGPTYRLDDLEGVLAHPGGSRTLVLREGWTRVVDPADWEDGAGAVAEIDALVGPDLLLPQPADPAQESRMPFTVAHPLVLPVTLVLGVLLLLGAIVGAAVWLTLSDVRPGPAMVAGGLAALAAAIIVRTRTRPRSDGP